MLTQLINLSISRRFVILVLALLVAGAGVYSAVNLPLDAVPDLTNIQVQIVTEAGSLSPLEVEQYISYPIETAMGGLPKVEEIRSVSKFGLSLVTVVFQEGTDIYWARQLVAQRLPAAAAAIPPAFGSPELGPLSTALGEILQFELRSDRRSLMELRALLDFDIAPRLREVPGVTEVNSHGGFFKSYEIRPDPVRMSSYGVTFEELFRCIESNHGTAGGGYVVHHDEQRFLRGEAMLRSISEMEQLVVRRQPDGTPLLLRDVASVQIAPLTRQGAATRDGRGEIVTGMVMMLIGENSRTVVEAAKKRLLEIQQTLPDDVHIEILYDRSRLIYRAIGTVAKNLSEASVLVVIVLLSMLGSIRAALLVAMAIPMSMLWAANLMYITGISASLMSLGAIDFGLIVDSSVITIENCMRRLSHADGKQPRFTIIRDAFVEVRRPTLFGELIIAIVYLPILALQGSEGKLFRPMSFTVLFALSGALVISLTLMPALATFVLPRRVQEREVWLVRWVKRLYRPVVSRAVRWPLLTVVAALAVALPSVPVALRLGAEFMPRLEEGDLLIEAVRLPSATLEAAVDMSTRIEKVLRRFPEVETVFCKTGRPEIANDVMGVHQTDVWVILKHRSRWPQRKSRDELIEQMDQALRREIPGVAFGFTQPIEMRVDELVAGVKADVAALIYGDDLATLNRLAKEVERILRRIPGAADVKAEYQADLPTLRISPRRSELVRYGLEADHILNVVAALGGRPVGTVYEGRARFPILVRIPAEWRENVSLLRQLPVAQIDGVPIPLEAVAQVVAEESPPSIEHDAMRRRTHVQCNVRGRDVGSFVLEAQQQIARQLKLPPSYELKWGGDFRNLQTASARLMIVTPIALLLILLLLQISLNSVRLALLIFLAIPMAACGGVYALALRGMPFSVSAGVGFIALFGVAVLNGLVWVNAAEHARRSGLSMEEAILTTALNRIRPILMTALVASLGFLPMAVSHSDGAEIQRPLATVVIGGLITATLLTSLVLPALYRWFAPQVAVAD
ncbi:MAG: cation transporter [Pirellulaceae bacterium]|nr:MAG: cation transporter [Pirellulaceae bacterium]